MERKLIKIEDDYVLVGSFTTPEEGMLFITRDNVLHTNIGWNYGDRLVIASTNTQHNVGKLSLKNCEAIKRGYDLDELAIKNYPNNNFYGQTSIEQEERQKAFVKGCETMIELMGDKKFSEDDLMEAYSRGQTNSPIQSLQQTEWDVEIEMELNLNGKNAIERSEYVPKLDADGCLILRKK